MPEKRKREHTAADGAADKKRVKHGFRVGPANLPDGAYKRYNDKVKKGLIERAQIKKKYAKVKQRFEAEQDVRPRPVEEFADEESVPTTTEVSTTPHPDRLDMMSRPNEEQDSKAGPPGRKTKPAVFARELALADRKRAEANARQAAREQADQQRQERLAEREQFRRAMAKSRTPDGKVKLGRQSNALLTKVKRMMG